MKFPKSSKIEGVVSSDPTRPAIENVYFDKDEGKLIATNGRIMAVVPVLTDENDTSGLLSPQSIKLARKEAGRLPIAQIHPNGALNLPSGVSVPRPTEDQCGKFPNWKQVVPPLFDPVFKVRIDAELLAKLAAALCDDKGSFVTLSFRDADSPFSVTGNIPDAFGVMLPARMT